MTDDYFPQATAELPLVMVAQLLDARKRTFEGYGAGQGVIWSGLAGAGKTRAARWLTAEISQKYKKCWQSPHRFTAVLYEASPERQSRKGAGMEALRDLFRGVTGRPLDPGLTRNSSTDEIVDVARLAIEEAEVGLVFIDEAQRLQRQAIDALVSVMNKTTAPESHQRMVFVLIGTEGFKPIAVDAKFKRRFTEYVRFEQLELSECQDFLLKAEPRLVEWDDGDFQRVSEYIYKASGGLPGGFLPLIRRASDLANQLGRPFTPSMVRAAQERNELDRRATHADQVRKGR